MKKMEITLNSNLNQVHHIFKKNVKDMDLLNFFWQKQSFTKEYVGKFEGKKFQLRSIQFRNYLMSPILNGEVVYNDDNIVKIKLANDLSIPLLIYLCLIPIFLILFGFSEFQNYGFQLVGILFSIFLVFGLFQFYIIKKKLKDLNNFILNIYINIYTKN